MIQVAGTIMVTIGLAMIYVPAGVVFAGLFIFAWGYMLEAYRARQKEIEHGHAQSDESDDTTRYPRAS